MTAKEAIRELPGEVGEFSFIGAVTGNSLGAVERTVRAAAKKASDDWTMASMAERQAAEATEARRAEAALAAATPWVGNGELYDASRGDDPNRRNASNSAHPHESVARIDLRRLEAEERARFAKKEAWLASRDDPDRPSARGRRIVELVNDLSTERPPPQDFDAGIDRMLQAVGAGEKFNLSVQ